MPEGFDAVQSSSPGLAAVAAGVCGRLRRLGMLVLGLGALAVAAVAAPEPEAVPRRWQLDVTTGPLRIALVESRDLGVRPYYYLPYTVTNNSGEDLLFAPAFELGTDDGEIMRSGRGVPLEVTKAIVEGLQNPYVEDQIAIIGQLLQGKENSKDGVVIWPVGKLDPTEVTVYGAGFSGETATVEIDDPKNPGQKKKVVTRKTLMVRYRVPGTLEGIGGRPLEEIERRWIMR